MKKIKKYNFVFFLLFSLFFLGNALAINDSTTTKPPIIVSQQLQPSLGTPLSAGTVKDSVDPTKTNTGLITCPAGYVLTQVSTGEKEYWNPKATATVTYTCSEACNQGLPYFGCQCGHNYCPTACPYYPGCGTFCNTSSTSYSGAWVKASTLLPNTSESFSPIKYNCSKVTNTWVPQPV